jgi:hypothetical protein
MNLFWLVGSIAVLAPALGCADDTLLGADALTTKEKVLKAIPVGTPLPEAQRIMQARGFSCDLMEQRSFAEDNPEGGRQLHHGPKDFLWCDSGQRWFKFPVTKRWQVTLAHAQGAITSIHVGVGLTGP